MKGIDAFELARGGEDPREPTAQRPPDFFHLVIFAGDLGGVGSYQEGGSSPFSFRWPRGAPKRLENGLLSRPRSGAITFGEVTIRHATGELVLSPAYERGGGLHGNHLIFRTASNGIGYAISLHAWEPLTDAEAVLRTIVASTDLGR
jgi:hypothetical protein